MSKDYSDTATLLQSLTENDFQAFAYLYNQSRKRLFIIAYLILQDTEASKDVVQDFFADFHQRREFENIVSLHSYMARSVRNRALNQKKREKIFSIIKADLSMKPEVLAPAYENKELKQELDSTISQLPPMAARVFLMHYVEHMNYNEISDELGISKSTVSSHMTRALKELRTVLQRKLI